MASRIVAKKSYDLLFKLLVVGEYWAGKACLLFRYADDTYNPNSYWMSGQYVGNCKSIIYVASSYRIL